MLMKAEKLDGPHLCLAIETAFPDISVALEAHGKLYRPTLDLGSARASALHCAIVDVLEQACAKITELDLVIVDIGPGSYTGLRVGIATVRTLREQLELEIRTLFSTDLIAELGKDAVSDGQDFLVCLDARRQSWFAARYRKQPSDRMVRRSEPACYSTEELRKEAGSCAMILTHGCDVPVDLPVHKTDCPSAELAFGLRDFSFPVEEPQPLYLMSPA